MLAQHHEIMDPEHGGSYTVKRYHSRKIMYEDESWEHEEVTLKPINRDFEPLVFRESAGELKIIAEVLETIGKADL